jgi:hypothetical protein
LELYEYYPANAQQHMERELLYFYMGCQSNRHLLKQVSWQKIKAISGCLMPSLWWMLRQQDGDKKRSQPYICTIFLHTLGDCLLWAAF